MDIPSKYYQRYVKKLFTSVVPKGKKTITFGGPTLRGKHDYILVPNTFAYIDDVQSTIKSLYKNCYEDTRVVVVYYNFLWKPLLDFATKMGWRRKDPKEPNWLTNNDIENFFRLENFDEVKKGRFFLFPIDLGPISNSINKFIAPLPIINWFCLVTYQIFRIKPEKKAYSVSIVIPTRNEAGNIKNIFKRVPKLGTSTELIFVEGGSTDNTYEAIHYEIKKNNRHDVSLFKQKGKGKGDAVRLGFKYAKNDILMILDADLTVDPSELPKFYNALANGHTEFANGSRLVYPMESQAMRTLNYFGNTIFSLVFTYLLGQRIKDTLCGTKVLFKKDYEKIASNRSFFGEFDPFGDFDLLFGASKLNLKIVDIPIRYKDRTYGTTNISRFKHGLLLIKMTLFAAQKLKFV